MAEQLEIQPVEKVTVLLHTVLIPKCFRHCTSFSTLHSTDKLWKGAGKGPRLFHLLVKHHEESGRWCPVYPCCLQLFTWRPVLDMTSCEKANRGDLAVYTPQIKEKPGILNEHAFELSLLLIYFPTSHLPSTQWPSFSGSFQLEHS